jgi:hypothetical protein
MRRVVSTFKWRLVTVGLVTPVSKPAIRGQVPDGGGAETEKRSSEGERKIAPPGTKIIVT